MKVYLDDERETPEGWIRVYWPEQAIELLSTGKVTELSLDHDLGDDSHGTGYDVVLWIEEGVATNGFVPPLISVHSCNSSARLKMESGISTIGEIFKNKQIVKMKEKSVAVKSMARMVGTSFLVSDVIENGRDCKDVISSLAEELGELGKEVRIKYGPSYKTPDVDGIPGEAVDVIINALDIIRVDNPKAKPEDVINIMLKKLSKWLEKEGYESLIDEVLGQ